MLARISSRSRGELKDGNFRNTREGKWVYQSLRIVSDEPIHELTGCMVPVTTLPRK